MARLFRCSAQVKPSASVMGEPAGVEGAAALSGGSTRMTSAPSSPSISAPNGPATTVDRSSTRIPESGCADEWEAVWTVMRVGAGNVTRENTVSAAPGKCFRELPTAW